MARLPSAAGSPMAPRRKAAGQASVGAVGKAATAPPRRKSAPGATVAVAASPSVPREEAGRIDEPVWLVRVVLLLFLVGFAAFLAREVYEFVQALG
ncbi:MAG TPA: hypothetical protein VM327_03950 [Candidatus Thermoplasmatota archaeon]|nr:hypothetical protein [Candidatus Thermoplasmatota archaeon]